MMSALRTLSEYARLYFALACLGVMSLLWSGCSVVLYRLLPPQRGTAAGRWVAMHCFRSYFRLLQHLGVARLDLSELDRLCSEGPLIIAPNHPSLLDAFMILARVPGACCIMKSAAADNIFLGGGAKLARYIRNDSVHTMIRRAVKEIGQGHSLLLFPEGTRSSGQPIGRFTRTVAVVARRAEVPIQTVFIEVNTNYLTKGRSIFSKPALPVCFRVRLGRRFTFPTEEHRFVDDLERYFAAELAPLAHAPRTDGESLGHTTSAGQRDGLSTQGASLTEGESSRRVARAALSRLNSPGSRTGG